MGPMVVAGIALSERSLQTLREAGVKDSKRLTRRSREKLFLLILEESLGVSVVRVWPEEIDSFNLNQLTYDAVLKVIRALSYLRPGLVTVDRVGREEVVVKEVRSIGSTPRVEFGADTHYVEAGAASVVAKVIRDLEIEKIRTQYGDVGSGYPSDPKTRKWVASIRGSEPPSFLRRSWRTLQAIAPELYVGKSIGH
ncbi:ribonuclease HII [Sulfodiicoccus acidiphilus]|uniref:Ribonuclease n=1 Tax=Sulfodiicoccus acidiphilus TaxID=1670455 RepID=A0A348B433_9CREN|nr:ribonuclease HII [Sulfodiicoccus acidiphilus]